MKVFKKLFFKNSIANDFIEMCTRDSDAHVSASLPEVIISTAPVLVNQPVAENEALYEVPTPEAKRKSVDHQCSCRLIPKQPKPATDNRIPKLSITSMECPICFEDFKPTTKIYQCFNGHLYCGDCKPKLDCLMCPQCRQPIPEDGIRNVFLEKIIKRIYERKPSTGQQP